MTDTLHILHYPNNTPTDSINTIRRMYTWGIHSYSCKLCIHHSTSSTLSRSSSIQYYLSKEYNHQAYLHNQYTHSNYSRNSCFYTTCKQIVCIYRSLGTNLRRDSNYYWKGNILFNILYIVYLMYTQSSLMFVNITNKSLTLSGSNVSHKTNMPQTNIHHSQPTHIPDKAQQLTHIHSSTASIS